MRARLARVARTGPVDKWRWVFSRARRERRGSTYRQGGVFRSAEKLGGRDGVSTTATQTARHSPGQRSNVNAAGGPVLEGARAGRVQAARERALANRDVSGGRRGLNDVRTGPIRRTKAWSLN